MIIDHTDHLDAPSSAPGQGSQAEPDTVVVVPDFETLYAGESDPWKVGSSFYEQRKLDILLASLGRRSYRAAWDPACGVGELARRLSARCRTVLATDLAASAVRLTRDRCGGEAMITVSRLTLPQAPDPAQEFDLVVLSEFLYYLDAEDRSASLTLVDACTSDDAEIVSVHWRHHPHDAWLSGAQTEAEIAEFLLARGWRRTVSHHDEEFVLSSFRRVGHT